MRTSVNPGSGENQGNTQKFALPDRWATAEVGFVGAAKIIDSREVQDALRRLAEAVAARRPSRPILALGIANGGIPIAQDLARRIAALTGTAVPCGIIDVSFHRDDLSSKPIPRETHVTDIPGEVNGADILLIDDVLFSGRTVKAALDELFDHGRPDRVELAVLIDRGHRRLPVAADYVGLNIETDPGQRVEVEFSDTDPESARIRIDRTD